MSDGSCRVFLVPVLARIRVRPINRANGIAPSECQSMQVSGRQEMARATTVGGNGDRIYFVHEFLESLAQHM
jgi:hypothetical protein